MDFSFLFDRFVYPFMGFVGRVLLCALMVFLAFVVVAFIKYRINPFKLTREKLVNMNIRLKLANFIRWRFVDVMDSSESRNQFREFGLTLYCGRQGSGKSISMVHYLKRMRERYPACIIVTNFSCNYADYIMEGWDDFFKYRNGDKGVIFAIDEIHSEYSSASWKDFPENLLSEISQQRKQRIKIIASSQVYSRIAKPIREQAFTVVICSTIGNRWTFNREYDALDMEALSNNPSYKIKSLWRTSFVQDEELRGSYDTYEKIRRMRDREFIPRNERGA